MGTHRSAKNYIYRLDFSFINYSKSKKIKIKGFDYKYGLTKIK